MEDHPSHNAETCRENLNYFATEVKNQLKTVLSLSTIGLRRSSYSLAEEMEEKILHFVSNLLDSLDNITSYTGRNEQECLDECLIAAVRTCRTEVCKLLIARGANVNAVYIGQQRSYPVLEHLLAYDTYVKVGKNEMYEILQLLVENNVDLNTRPGQKPYLMMAVTRMDFNLCKLLIDQGVDVNAKDERYGNTALHYAVTYSWPYNTVNKNEELSNVDDHNEEPINAEITHEECHHMVSMQVFSYSDVVLQFAECTLCKKKIDLSNEQGKIVELLLDNKADITLRNKKHDTSLLSAVRSGNYEMSKLLIASGAEVNVFDHADNSIFHVAAQIELRNGDFSYTSHDEIACKMFELLLGNKANPHKVNEDGETCLMTSANAGLTNASEILINAGVDVNAVNSMRGFTALHYVVNNDYSIPIMPLVTLLIGNGANVMIKTKPGDDILQYACLYKRIDVFDYISHLYTSERLVDAYKLLGITFILGAVESWASSNPTSDNMDQGIGFWHKAITLQLQNSQLPKGNPVSCSRLAFRDVMEIQTLEDLEEIRTNFNALFVQVLLIYRRIIGPFHVLLEIAANTTEELEERQEFDRCYILEVIKYILESRMMQSFHHRDTISSIGNVKDHFLFCFRDNNYIYRSSDVLDVMEFITEECGKSLKNRTRKVIISVLSYFPDFFYVFFLSTPTAQEVAAFRKLVFRINLILSSKGVRYLLLHNVCSYKNAEWRRLLCAQIVNVLLECGGVVHAVDKEKRSSLHVVASLDTVEEETVDVLLRHGGHIDQADINGQRVYELLEGRYELDIHSHITLKCMAACVIKKSGISYIHQIPSLLFGFIEMH